MSFAKSAVIVIPIRKVGNFRIESGERWLCDNVTFFPFFGALLCVYKANMHSCQENIEWSGSGVEQKSGISHLFNLSKIDHAGF